MGENCVPKRRELHAAQHRGLHHRDQIAAGGASGTVSVIRLNLKNGVIFAPSKHILVGTEPYGLALTPNGKKLYVSDSRSDTVSVIDTATDTVITAISGAGPEPRGIAITNNGNADDNDETVYVTQFLSLPVAGKVDGQDDAKAGHVRSSPRPRTQ